MNPFPLSNRFEAPGNYLHAADAMIRRSNIICAGPGTGGYEVARVTARAMGGTFDQNAIRDAMYRAARGLPANAVLPAETSTEIPYGKVVDPTAF